MAAPNLELPRTQWPANPHYPQQVLLVRSHESFRLHSRRMVARAEGGGAASALARSFLRLKSAMRGHEAYEEHKLYPYLEARWSISCDPLRHGHHQLDAAEADVLAELLDADGPATDDLVDALRHHDEVLHTHLDEEESVVIPALLALTPDEFSSYYHRDIHTLLAQLERT